MRVHFQERPWDLFLALGYVASISIFILATGQGLLAAILLVLFIPGYVLVAALFPGNEGISWLERIVLSFGLSLAAVPLLALLLNFTPFGIRLVPIVLSILTFSAGLGLLAHLRRMNLRVEKRLFLTIEIRKPAWSRYSVFDKTLAIGLVISVLFSLTILAYVATTPRPGEGFTEFYVLGPEWSAEDYPTVLNVSEEGMVILGIANHEFEPVAYTVLVDLVGVARVWNESEGTNVTVELNRTTMDRFDVALEHAANWTRPFTFRIDVPGQWQVQFLLFRAGDLESPYLYLHLLARVGGP